MEAGFVYGNLVLTEFLGEVGGACEFGAGFFIVNQFSNLLCEEFVDVEWVVLLVDAVHNYGVVS